MSRKGGGERESSVDMAGNETRAKIGVVSEWSMAWKAGHWAAEQRLLSFEHSHAPNEGRQ